MKRSDRGENLLSLRYQFRAGDVKFSEANTDEHEIAKAIMCREATRLGHRFITEAIFQDIKRRADIFLPDQFEVWEITETEERESIEEKKKDYATIGVSLRSFKARTVITTWHERLARKHNATRTISVSSSLSMRAPTTSSVVDVVSSTGRKNSSGSSRRSKSSPTVTSSASDTSAKSVV